MRETPPTERSSSFRCLPERRIRFCSRWPGPQSPPQFSWLPDNRHVLIALADDRMSGTRLWLADTQRDTVRRLTIGPGSEGSPAVSANGRITAFTSEGTDFDLVLISNDGSASPFYSTTRNEIDPVWSPTARQYAFVTDRRGNQEIWLRSEDGSWERSLVTEQEFSGMRTLVFGALISRLMADDWLTNGSGLRDIRSGYRAPPVVLPFAWAWPIDIKTHRHGRLTEAGSPT